MARRMFSPSIVNSDKFLDMGVSARELYFQLGMHADDDGFVSPKKIMRMVGAPEDDLKVLLAKTFLIPFESGVIVIKHWRVNNLVRKDWYRPTTYQEEKSLISSDICGVYHLLNKGIADVKHLVNEPVNVGSKVVSKVTKEIEASKEALEKGREQLVDKLAPWHRKKV